MILAKTSSLFVSLLESKIQNRTGKQHWIKDFKLELDFI